ncbi:RnfABCDGE type electron transport complex subunit B [Zophobihabitans entericus]|uniref:RnfABCDGE type electron transport complex subunit B n=1 Tax=Zophobihabitans entericus TaxID=1635327 RepID=A0A6G9I7V7_9GAMM|nr:RnfABCDGE type electron transport complex subunit B [Zophobihabitans entericus]QIQ20293.1 RnfABCDGE type electron transport complex subunit B [Zophobihabitans entericus]
MTIVLKAYIDEANCIGCAKCSRSCPTDAIVGSKHTLHTILPQLCTSCSKCIDVCPTNCITLHTPGEEMNPAEELRLTERKQSRLVQQSTFPSSTVATIFTPIVHTPQPVISLEQRKQTVADAIARARAKKLAQQKPE